MYIQPSYRRTSKDVTLAQENREEHVNVSSSGKLYNIESPPEGVDNLLQAQQ